jgi:dTMP kinase
MLEPDLVVLLDVSAEEGLRRTNSRNPSGTITDTFETEKIEFHNRVREGYMNTAQHSETPFLILDANMPLLDVWQQIEPLVVTLAKR